MKLLHTADWHLGRQFEGHSLEDDQHAVLHQVYTAITRHKPDALLIAGDVFDRAAPPETAVRLFNAFLNRVIAETETAVVIIAGNHDSADRIGAWATLADPRRTLVRGPLAADERPLILKDAHGPVAISALPFGYEYAARDVFDRRDLHAPADVLAAQIQTARGHVPPGARWVVVAHAFVSGGELSGNERSLTRQIGGVEHVPPDVFTGAHYVALGHLHRAQAVGAAHIRYAGAPLAFAFEEEGCKKSMTLVDIDANGVTQIELLPFEPLRNVRTLRGTLAEILAMDASPDFVRPILTDPTRLIDPMKRLRDRFPHACGLRYAHEPLGRDRRVVRGDGSTAYEPSTVIAEFLAYTRGHAATDAEQALIKGHLGDIAHDINPAATLAALNLERAA
jgi:DNA repair protein SbcD/Mre11